MLDHVVERNALRPFGEDENLSLVLIRQEAFGNGHEQVGSSRHYHDGNRHGGKFVPQRDLQSAIVKPQQPVEEALEKPPQPAVLYFLRRAQETAAQHGREAERDHAGDQNRHADGDRKFVQQPSQNAAHEKHGNEHCRQRQGHGNDGEADFARPAKSRFHRRLAHLHVAHDVFQHHDGVIDHEADRQGQGHQRQIVQRIAQQIHDRERAHDGHGQRHAGNRRGR